MNTINNMSERATRKYLRNRFGLRKYKITKVCGIPHEIHVYGQMPNANSTGWYLLGYFGVTPLETSTI